MVIFGDRYTKRRPSHFRLGQCWVSNSLNVNASQQRGHEDKCCSLRRMAPRIQRPAAFKRSPAWAKRQIIMLGSSEAVGLERPAVGAAKAWVKLQEVVRDHDTVGCSHELAPDDNIAVNAVDIPGVAVQAQ
jgi:hypothetical protein